MGKINRNLEKGTYFSIVSHNEECRKNIKEVALDMPYYCYIDHQPDKENGSEHTHLIISMNGTRTIQQVADRFSIPPNYVQVVKSIRVFHRYLLHLDQLDKIKYTINDVITNKPQVLQKAVENSRSPATAKVVFHSLQRVRNGEVSVDDFLDEFQPYVDEMSFIGKIKLFESLQRISNSERAVPDLPRAVRRTEVSPC